MNQTCAAEFQNDHQLDIGSFWENSTLVYHLRRDIKRPKQVIRIPKIMIYTGVDLIEIHRIATVRDRYHIRFLNKIFTPGEQRYARNRAPQLASRFAAKEAVMKALGTGVRGIPWKSIEVTRRRGGPPEITLHGNARKRAERMGVKRIALSLSHSRDFAVASVVLEARDDAWRP